MEMELQRPIGNYRSRERNLFRGEHGIRRFPERQFVGLKEKAEPVRREPKKLLIVDDELADSLERFFSLSEIKVIKAKNRQEGIEKAIQEKPDVVSLDNYMPFNQCDRGTAAYGTEIAEAIKKHLPRTYIVGFSSAPESFDSKYFDAILNKVKQLLEYKSTILGYLRR